MCSYKYVFYLEFVDLALNELSFKQFCILIRYFSSLISTTIHIKRIVARKNNIILGLGHRIDFSLYISLLWTFYNCFQMVETQRNTQDRNTHKKKTMQNLKFVCKSKTVSLSQIASLYWPSVGSMLSFMWAQCQKITSAQCNFAHRRNIAPTRWREVGQLTVD